MEALQFFPLSYARCRFLVTDVTKLSFLLRTNIVHTSALIKIAKIANCNHKTVAKWLNRWNETKDLIDCLRSGALRITTIE